MNSRNISIWKAKLKTARAEERQWAKQFNQAERGLLRVGREIDQLEKKIELELARTAQKTAAHERK